MMLILKIHWRMGLGSRPSDLQCDPAQVLLLGVVVVVVGSLFLHLHSEEFGAARGFLTLAVPLNALGWDGTLKKTNLDFLPRDSDSVRLYDSMTISQDSGVRQSWA